MLTPNLRRQSLVYMVELRGHSGLWRRKSETRARESDLESAFPPSTTEHLLDLVLFFPARSVCVCLRCRQLWASRRCLEMCKREHFANGGASTRSICSLSGHSWCLLSYSNLKAEHEAWIKRISSYDIAGSRSIRRCKAYTAHGQSIFGRALFTRSS